jgi:hypothetical protein
VNPADLGGCLPVGVAPIGRAASDWHLLDIGIQLQGALGIPAAP